MIKLPTGEGARPFTSVDVPLLLTNLKQIDLKEITLCTEQLGLQEPKDYLMSLVGKKDIYTLHDELNRPLAMLGLFPHMANSVRMILLITEDLHKYSFKFLKIARKLFKDIIEPYEIIFTYSLVRDANHLKFLKIFGFKLYESIFDPKHGFILHHIQTKRL